MEKYLSCYPDSQLNIWRKIPYANLITIKPHLVKMGYPDNLTDDRFNHEVCQALNRLLQSSQSLSKRLGWK